MEIRNIKNKYVLSFVLGSMIGGASACYGSDGSHSSLSSLSADERSNESANENSQSTSQDFNGTPLPWNSVDEARKYIYGLKKSKELDLKYIEDRIIATADTTNDDEKKIKSVICELWEIEGYLNIMKGMIFGIIEFTNEATNKREKLLERVMDGRTGIGMVNHIINNDFSPNESVKIMDNLISIARNKSIELARKIVDTSSEQEMGNDFIQLAIYKASLHEATLNGKSYDFESLIKQMIDVYECTKNNTYKKLIKEELQNINIDNGRFGPFGHEINDFEDLENILAGQ